ncbi:MAG TPA: hypothetical protein VFJ90_01460 [Candidatus Didemnitutus sp.]|nr:hypothetical protein [Candidatus Didemnitutus sp.]
MYTSRPFGLPPLVACTALYLSLALAILAQIISLPSVPIEPPAKSFVASLGQVPVPAEAPLLSATAPRSAWLQPPSLTPPVRTGIQLLHELQREFPAPANLAARSPVFPELRGAMLVADLAANVAPRPKFDAAQFHFRPMPEVSLIAADFSDDSLGAFRAGPTDRTTSLVNSGVAESVALAH